MYAELLASHHFIAVAIETSGVLGPEAAVLQDSEAAIQGYVTLQLRTWHIHQCAVVVQRGNTPAVQLLGSC